MVYLGRHYVPIVYSWTQLSQMTRAVHHRVTLRTTTFDYVCIYFSYYFSPFWSTVAMRHVSNPFCPVCKWFTSERESTAARYMQAHRIFTLTNLQTVSLPDRLKNQTGRSNFRHSNFSSEGWCVSNRGVGFKRLHRQFDIYVSWNSKSDCAQVVLSKLYY